MNHLPQLNLQLLGAPQISYNGSASMERISTKAQALVYYLAMTGRPHTRIALASLLWGEHGEGEARRNLRKVIQQLRAHFEPYFAIDHQTIGFHSAQAYWADAVEFAAKIADFRAANAAQLQPAIALYGGDFLEGFYVRDAPAFESWMLSERARLRELMLQGLDTLAVRYADAGSLSQAIMTTRRLLELEPWREESHRQLMIWLAQNGQRSAALAQYEVCCHALTEELAVEPSQATRELYERLLHQHSSDSAGQALSLTAAEYALVGRQVEWQILCSAWHKMMQAGAHFVCIAGEAGIGKTRLAEELLLYAHRQGHATARTRAYALEGRLAYAPLADWLRADTLQGKAAKLNPVWLSEVARLLPELLIQHPSLPAPLPLIDRGQQKRLFEALLHAFTPDSRPLLLLLDDLQWCDPETLAWLQYLLDAAPQARLLVVGTVRNDEVNDDHPLHKLSRNLLRAGKLTTIELAPLNAEETATLGAQVTKHAPDGQAASKLYKATGGNPLFVVESVRVGEQGIGGNRYSPRPEAGSDTSVGALWTRAAPGTADDSIFRGAVQAPYATLPPKVYAVIQARLAQLSPATRTLAQWAATVGRAFTVPLLMQASQQDEETVVQGLDELWRRRLVREQGSVRYDFTHDRIRDVAYAESSPVKRALFHQRVAQALEKLHADNLAPVAGELAGHYQRAGALEQAFVYFRQAATVAKQLYAHSEVVDYLQKAIATAQLLPPSPAITAVEIDLWHELGLTQVVVHDWSSERVATAWQKADELAAQSGSIPQRCRALGALAGVARNRGHWSKVRELSDLVLSLAEESGDLLLINGALVEYAFLLYHCGEFAPALQHFKRHPLLTDAPVKLTYEVSDSLSPGIFLHSAKCLWLLGFPDQALARGRKVLELRHQHIDFMDRFPALDFTGMLYSFLRDAPIVQLLGQELTAISIRYDFPFFASAGQMLTGWAMAQQGDPQRGLPLARQSIDDQHKRGIRMFEPYWRAMLAETLALAGEIEEALDEVTAALVYAEECGNCYWNAQLLKLKGDFLQRLAASAGEVELWYQRAIATARQQGAKSLELRAMTSLCRLWQRLGQPAVAHQHMAACYGWFTEGFATVDLQEAKALLDELQAVLSPA